MPVVVSTVHDPRAVAAACHALGLPPPAERAVRLDHRAFHGWVVQLPGLRYPVVCDTLRGLVAYHRFDNAFARYAHLIRFLFRCYDCQAALRRRGGGPAVPGHPHTSAGQVA